MFKQFARTPTEQLELVLQKIQAARSRSFSFVDVEVTPDCVALTGCLLLITHCC